MLKKNTTDGKTMVKAFRTTLEMYKELCGKDFTEEHFHTNRIWFDEYGQKNEQHTELVIFKTTSADGEFWYNMYDNGYSRYNFEGTSVEEFEEDMKNFTELHKSYKEYELAHGMTEELWNYWNGKEER